MPVKLGVNIDHVATLRQARGIGVPNVLEMAQIAMTSGADFIVIHLRQDRRHIQDADLFELTKNLKGDIHLEMACVPEMEKIALKSKPHSVCLVPEGKHELTTQGGLNLKGKNLKDIERAITTLKKAGIGVSLFVDPDASSIRMAHKLGADTVELCTKIYAEANTKNKQKHELENLAVASILTQELKMRIHSGHGLDYFNASPVAKIEGMDSLNIGFSIIARSLIAGLANAVAEMKAIIS